MNIAVVKHNPEPGYGNKFLFSVPEGVKLKAGDVVMCQTKHGPAFGWLVYDSFEAEGAALKAISDAYGAEKLKPILGVYELSEFEGGSVQELDADSVRGKEVTCIANIQVTEIIHHADWEDIEEDSVISAEGAIDALKQIFDDVQCLGTKFFVRDVE